MKQHIPNGLTLLNVFCGSCALVFFSKGAYTEGVALVGISLVADFLDGAVARWLRVSSDMGKELDSLADMVTFGVVPGYLLYLLIAPYWVKYESLLSIVGENEAFDRPSVAYFPVIAAALPAFIITAFSCYRLAKFNLDTRQSEGFIGLATPANTLFYIGLLAWRGEDNVFLTENIGLFYALIPLSSYLLVSEIPMFSFKIKSFSWVGNEIRFIFAGAALLLGVVFKAKALSLVIVLYVVLNLVVHLMPKKPKNADVNA